VNFKRRLLSLEKRSWPGRVREPLRVVITRAGEGGSERSTCSRTRNADGGLTEIIDLSSRDEDMGEEELERFIAAFPIRPGPQCGHGL
jgi:hypothetical protein